MYSIDEKVLQAYAADSREIYVKAIFNNNLTVLGDKIKSFTVTDSVGNTDGLTLGNACSKKLELDMFVPENLTSIAKAKIEIEVGIDVDGIIEYTPLGVFYVDDYKTTNDYKSVQITAFDAMLKIQEELGNTYTCSLASSNVRPVGVINDICSQAGITVSIGEATEQKSIISIREAEGVLYDPNGVKYDSLCSIGTSDLISIPNGATSIDVNLFGFENTNLNYSAFRAVYFKDAEGKYIHSYKDYNDLTFGDYAEFDDDGNLVQRITGTITPPIYNGTLYLGFDFNTSAFDTLPEGLQFKVITNYTETNYVNDDVLIRNPQKVEIPARDMLGYMAGILGCNAVVDRTGVLTVRKLEATSNTIPYRLQYMGGLEKTHENVLPIEYLTTGSSADENGNGGVISVGSGSYGFNFENPYIASESAAQSILDLYKGIEILPCNVNYRGNPAIDCGDIISVQDKDLNYYNVLVLNNTISVTGGMSAKIDSSLKTDVKQDFISMPSSKRVEHKLDSFISAYQDIIKELVGVQGGYVQQVKDDNNVVRALAITQNNIQVKWDEANGKVIAVNSLDKSTPMWVWSYGGLSFSSNGGATYDIAINMKGQVYANYLQSPLGYIGGFEITDTSLRNDTVDGDTTYRTYIQAASNNLKSVAFGVQKRYADGSTGHPFYVRHNGDFCATQGTVGGWEINQNGFHKGDCDITTNGYINCQYINDIGSIVVGENADVAGYVDCSKLYCTQGKCRGDLDMSGDVLLKFATVSGAAPLYVNSSRVITTATSSKRYKENITEELEDSLNPDKLYNLPVVQYNYKPEYKDNALVAGTQIGVTAEDVAEHYPNACIYNENGEPENWQDRIMIPAMLKLIQEQKLEMDKLKAKQDEQDKKISALEKMIAEFIKG